MWLISDSLVGAICIGGIVIKIAQSYRIDLQNLPSLKPMILDESFIRNSKQFTSTKREFGSMTLVNMKMWKYFFKRLKNTKVRKNKTTRRAN